MRHSEKPNHITGKHRLVALLLVWIIVAVGSGASLGQGTEATDGEAHTEEIRQAVTQFLLSNHPWKSAEVRVRDVRVPGCRGLPTQSADLSMRVAPNSRYLGSIPVEVTLNEGQADQRKIWVSTYVEVLSPVVVLKRPLARNQVISDDDVCLEKKDLSKVPPGAVTDVDAVVGQRLKRTLAVGTVLRGAWLDKPTLVKRGDVVKLMIETAVLRITALGRADEQGGMGDTVRVINLDSKRRVYGQVVDRQTVRVRY